MFLVLKTKRSKNVFVFSVFRVIMVDVLQLIKNLLIQQINKNFKYILVVYQKQFNL
jgi:hypothetical protein